ncbi:para-aminobenzoate synthetase [Kineococcus radiotolerans]|uniref:aminodeoxychorismate synthase n=1 Tax=Kineococcus radiotolerans TaxID=131568 RepID=A0A7W4XX83_KINRA|nr:chorismate-binding protein [Kineococcus radiotolerans]MBB2901698.1 para-aminobenzoate synthetase [Kineococcus radiotolerans]
MRWLVVDNHDSYTHNLVQLLAVATGTDPVVVSDDDVAPGELDLDGFAGVVVSPGPGHPANARDFALSADVLARAEVPVLGVCLGMQGIALAEGAVVDPAPRPRHGFVDRVRHTGTSVLTGLPQDFAATRYHSFRVAEPLPDSLEPLAWAGDGVLMALRHRSRPLVGVQFHPESVASTTGALIVENFVRWCRRWGSRPHRLHARRCGPAVDTERAFAHLFPASDAAFWLDSAARGAGSGRFSFLGEGTGPVVDSLAGLAARLRERAVTGADAVPFEFAGGLVGWAGYEARDECGFPTSRRDETPPAAWVFCDRFVAVDHDEDTTWVVALSEDEAEPAWLEEAAGLLADLPPLPPPAPAPEAAVTLDTPPARYRQDVLAAQRQLVAGESYEICLTTRARVRAAGDPFDAYRRLRRANPAPYAAYLRIGGVVVLSSSPERFLRIGTSGAVETRPIKGTAALDSDPAALQADPKTRAENLMVVDLLRNDLGRVCVPGSVTVPDLMAVETLPTVHQLVTTVRGRLRPEVTAVDCLLSCFPPGSMTGAPKLRTTEIIDALEQRPRGIYSGTIGWFSTTGAADLAVVIRTAVLVGDEWRVGAGGAVVLDSDPDAEVAEVLLKLRAPLAALTTSPWPGRVTPSGGPSPRT